MYSTNHIQQESHSLSIVMPVYNEERVIEKVVRDFCDTVLNRFEKPQFVLVNDCSDDATSSILEKLKKEYPYIKLVHHSQNQGHGPSVLDGFSHAKGNYIFQVDSDNQFAAEDFWLLWNRMQTKNIDLVIGARKSRKDPGHRLFISKALRIIVRIFFNAHIQDINSPFRLYKRSAVEKILPNIAKTASIPSVLMALSAKKIGLRVEEIPVQHLPRNTGRVSIQGKKLVKICWRALKELKS